MNIDSTTAILLGVGLMVCAVVVWWGLKGE